MQDLTAMGERIGRLLKESGQTVAVSESSTGGLVSAALLAVPGASAYFLGGGVIYTRSARDALLGIGNADMKGMRSSSEPYAQLAARTIRRSSTTSPRPATRRWTSRWPSPSRSISRRRRCATRGPRRCS